MKNALILAGMVVVALTGCGEKKAEEAAPAPAASAAVAPAASAAVSAAAPTVSAAAATSAAAETK
jgi:hypothetical protein